MTDPQLVNFLSNNWHFFVLMALWALPWKGVALWQAAKRGEKWWFMAMLVTNTVAILEIVYLFFIVKIGRGKSRAEHN